MDEKLAPLSQGFWPILDWEEIKRSNGRHMNSSGQEKEENYSQGEDEECMMLKHVFVRFGNSVSLAGYDCKWQLF